MLKTYYHATPVSNFESIKENGLLANKLEHCVFICEKPEDSAKFMMIRGISDFIVIPVELEDSKVEESFDHSQAFFKCRAYMYPGDIPKLCIDFTNILVPTSYK